MAAAEIFFLPSKGEGLSLMLFEAMSMQVALVAADVGGQRELVTPECGFLIPQGENELQEYVSVLTQLILWPELCVSMGQAGRRRIVERFTIERMAERMIELLNRAQELSQVSARPAVGQGLGLECATLAVEYTRVEKIAIECWGQGQELNAIKSSLTWRVGQRVARSLLGRLIYRVVRTVMGKPQTIGVKYQILPTISHWRQHAVAAKDFVTGFLRFGGILNKEKENKITRSAKDVWNEGLAHELHFWDWWFRTKGLIWPEGYIDRLNPNQPLQQRIENIIQKIPRENINILDVGAGPLTLFGKRSVNRNIKITAVDPLADEYNALLKKYKVKPVVVTQKAEAETLLEVFAENTFDVVHAQNCIDHCYDPLLAIKQMIAVAKEGGTILLGHAESEAEKQDYAGLHQWNFTVEGGAFIIKGHGREINVNDELEGVANIVSSCENNWVSNQITKL